MQTRRTTLVIGATAVCALIASSAQAGSRKPDRPVSGRRSPYRPQETPSDTQRREREQRKLFLRRERILRLCIATGGAPPK